MAAPPDWDDIRFFLAAARSPTLAERTSASWSFSQARAGKSWLTPAP